MKFSTPVIGLVMATVTVAPAVAQQSLGEVAGSIKLKRPEGESVVIDQNAVGKTRRTSGGDTESDFFRQAVRDCVTETQALYGLIVETRDGTSFYRDEWRARVLDAGFLLDAAREDLGMVRAEGRYVEAYEVAVRGSNTAAAALDILRGAISNDQPVYSQARELSREAIRLFGEAEAAIGSASRANVAEGAPPLINPIEADRNMTALCRGRYGDGTSGFDACIAEQRAALDEITRRSWPGVGLDASVFNVIRNNCRFEWPDNYVDQDRCERERVASKTR